jgi:hypothetical protein
MTDWTATELDMIGAAEKRDIAPTRGGVSG